MSDKILIGWREWVSLPALGIPAIKSKIDTGARSSALHVCDLEDYHEHDHRKVRFILHPLQRQTKVEITCHADVVDERTVSDSGGHRERRLVIRTPLQVAGQQWPVEITLTNREDMLFRMLLGRTAMLGRLVVDPELSYQCGRALRRAYRKANFTKG